MSEYTEVHWKFLARLKELEDRGVTATRRWLWSPTREDDRARQKLCRNGLAAYRNSAWCLTDAGREMLRRHLAGEAA